MDKDRLSTVAELSTILAHEIKNPMNSIIINMEVLRSAVVDVTGGLESPSAVRAKKYLDVIEGEIRRLDKVIKGFLDFATPPQNTKVQFNLNSVIQSIVEFMRQEMKQKNVTVQLKLAEDLPALVGSPDQIKQALLNLMLNALQALPSGGIISICTSADEKRVSISIEDNGIGIDEKIIGKIFNPYFTTKAKGSGLGLTIVRQVAKEHSGEVLVDSRPNSGTLFTLVFPRKVLVDGN